MVYCVTSMGFLDKTKGGFSTYQPTEEELTNRQLTAVTWYVRNRALLEKIGTGLLILFCIVTVGYSTVKWGEYFIFGYFDDQVAAQRQVAEFPNYRRIQALYGAAPLAYGRVDVLRGSSEKFDFLTSIRNPNERWIAAVTYHYEFVGGRTDAATTIILPGQQHVLAELGVEHSSFPSQARLVVEETNWSHISAHLITDVPEYVDERLKMNLDNLTYSRGRAGESPENTIRFSISNDSAYSYWNADFYAILLNGSQIVGIRPLLYKEFLSGQTRESELRLINIADRVSDIELITDINVFNRTEFILPEDS